MALSLASDLLALSLDAADRASSRLCASADAALAGLPPHQAALAGACAALAAAWVLSHAEEAVRDALERGVANVFFDFARSLPVVRGVVAAQKAKVLRQLERGAQKKGGQPVVCELPERGVSTEDLLAELSERHAADARWDDGKSQMSGTVYIGSSNHTDLLCRAYALYAHSNPLHSDSFPSVGRMEREVVAMTAAALGARAAPPGVCGGMTSGGTESILTALRASRDYVKQRKGLKDPVEVVCCVSAHAAVYKAAQYFGMRLRVVGVDKDGRMDVAAARRAVGVRTAVVYCSAPSYPHGVMDDVQQLAAAAQGAGACCHVDACLGGFVMPFLPGVKPFGFDVEGVTTISADTHKFGMAQKGSSVCLFRTRELRKHSFTAVTEWSGGLYVSPGQAGSRPGGLIAQTWTAMMHVGRAGYENAARGILRASERLQAHIAATPCLEVLHRPEAMIVAWRSSDRRLNIYELNDVLARKGWSLNALQAPPAIHMCLTAAHSIEIVDRLGADIKKAVEQLLADPSSGKGGNAPIYGLAGAVPDRGAIGSLLGDVQDVMLENA